MVSKERPDIAADNLATSIRRRMKAAGGGIDLELPPRGPIGEPLSFEGPEFDCTEDGTAEIAKVVRARLHRLFADDAGPDGGAK